MSVKVLAKFELLVDLDRVEFRENADGELIMSMPADRRDVALIQDAIKREQRRLEHRG